MCLIFDALSVAFSETYIAAGYSLKTYIKPQFGAECSVNFLHIITTLGTEFLYSSAVTTMLRPCTYMIGVLDNMASWTFTLWGSSIS